MLYRSFLFFLLLGSLVVTGCETNNTTQTATEWIPFEGEVVWVKTSRGFWALKTRKLGKITPLKLPEAFKVNELKVRGEVLLHPDAESSKNWGIIGEVRKMERVE
jgi:hypothetical protein